MGTETVLDQHVWHAAVDQTKIDRLNTHKLGEMGKKVHKISIKTVIKLKLTTRAPLIFHFFFIWYTNSEQQDQTIALVFFLSFPHQILYSVQCTYRYGCRFRFQFITVSRFSLLPFFFMNATFTMDGDKHTLVASNEPIILITIAFVSQ